MEVERTIIGDEARSVFHHLTPFIEQAGYTWTESLGRDGLDIKIVKKDIVAEASDKFLKRKVDEMIIKYLLRK